jgi:hypothetical protein
MISGQPQMPRRRRLQRLNKHLVLGPQPPAATSLPHRHPAAGGTAIACVPTLTTVLPAGVPMQPTGGGHTHPNIAVTADGTVVLVCAAVLDDSTPGKDCLICFHSNDRGRTWSEPAQIAPSHFKPPSVTSLGGTGDFECYPGTLNALPDGRLLLTWTYNGINLPEEQQRKSRAPPGGGVGAGHPGGGDHGAFLYALSSDGGYTWSEATEISDTGGPQEGFLGTSRHSVLPWPDGRWCIAPRDPPDDEVAVRIHDRTAHHSARARHCQHVVHTVAR